MTKTESPAALNSLALDSGGLAMIAMDQRESLRQMLGSDQRTVPDQRLVDFKVSVARTLSPAASGFLIDHDYGYEAVVRADAVASGCGLILAVDLLDQPAGMGVLDTELSEDLLAFAGGSADVVAAKLLVIWQNDGRNDARIAMADRFVERCRALGLVSVLEGVTSAPDGPDHAAAFNAAVYDAARALGGLRPDLYKAQVPNRGTGDRHELLRACEQLNAALQVPWVILSNGVRQTDFSGAVEAACRAGASGMLAGRALWSDAVRAADPQRHLADVCRPRLERLVEIVRRHGRSWHEAARA